MSDSTDDLLKERGEKYGDMVLTHTRIAQVWSGILDTEVTAQQVALCMIGLKAVRAAVTPEHEDNYADIAGYQRIAERISIDTPVTYVLNTRGMSFQEKVDTLGEVRKHHVQNLNTGAHPIQECEVRGCAGSDHGQGPE